MIKIENVETMGWEAAIRGMRNPMNSWDKSDSGICKGGDNGIGCGNCVEYDCRHEFDNLFKLGSADYKLMNQLALGGPVHAKYRRMITVYLDITAPLYWWKEFDTYKIGTVVNSCSTMHKIAEKEFDRFDFSHDKLDIYSLKVLDNIIETLNIYRNLYNKGFVSVPDDELLDISPKDKRFWWQMIQLLPNSYNQRRTIMLNYEVLAGIYPMRKDHKLDEWREFCQWIESLPYSGIITNPINTYNVKNPLVQESIEEMLERTRTSWYISPISKSIIVNSIEGLTLDEQARFKKEWENQGIKRDIIFRNKNTKEK